MIQIKNLDRIIGMQTNGRIIVSAEYDSKFYALIDEDGYKFKTNTGEEIRLTKPLYAEVGEQTHPPYRLFVMGWAAATEIAIELNQLRSSVDLAAAMYDCLERLDKHRKLK